MTATTLRHGHTRKRSKSKAYAAWASMKQRCLYKKCPRYEQYGGRGIKVCKRWLNSFDNFLSDMGEPPTPEHSLDRINVNKGYYKSNCRWASKEEQANNRSNNVFVAFEGRTLTVSQWGRELGIKGNTIRMRLNRGKSVEEALSS